jgi:hypothetical protein
MFLLPASGAVSADVLVICLHSKFYKLLLEEGANLVNANASFFIVS